MHRQSPSSSIQLNMVKRLPSLSWLAPFDEKKLILEHVGLCQQYDECCSINAALRNQLHRDFEDTCLTPLNNAFTGYSGTTTIPLPSHIYVHYTSILATDLAVNNQKLRQPFNPNEPLESLYMRLNKCVDYATQAGDPVTKGKVIHISYSLVAETGQFQ